MVIAQNNGFLFRKVWVYFNSLFILIGKREGKKKKTRKSKRNELKKKKRREEKKKVKRREEKKKNEDKRVEERDTRKEKISTE